MCARKLRLGIVHTVHRKARLMRVVRSLHHRSSFYYFVHLQAFECGISPRYWETWIHTNIQGLSWTQGSAQEWFFTLTLAFPVLMRLRRRIKTAGRVRGRALPRPEWVSAPSVLFLFLNQGWGFTSVYNITHELLGFPWEEYLGPQTCPGLCGYTIKVHELSIGTIHQINWWRKLSSLYLWRYSRRKETQKCWLWRHLEVHTPTQIPWSLKSWINLEPGYRALHE